MTTPASAASTPTAAAAPRPGPAADTDPRSLRLQSIVETLVQLSDDASVPRNVRRGALAAKEELTRARVAPDVRVASAVSVLDDLANDPNIPTHGRTAIWSIISSLESLP